MNNIGFNIRKVREQKGFSQEYVANQLNISQASYARLENEDTKVTVDRLFQIAKILETEISDFFDENKLNIQSQTYNADAYGHGYVQYLVIESKETLNKLVESYQERLKEKDEQINLLKSLLEQYKDKKQH
ncbi:helix-turn-helix domain-containing protein [Capnocytophaga sp.]|uniref:helix-turn-helix domain-containing protein n=1 Tax=Capnocytophaga sp. TaxID=44737 RepID=UPI0026DB7DE4|nr:helix-turn-helix transcriptional regulator [Capnocytophaga sp.]MDO5105055.1 helix-turn-helix transcriptional regulator [Capnocytophaga sp.]